MTAAKPKPLDPTKLTLGEIATVEELSGQPFTGLSDGERPKGKALAALVFVAKRRHEPAFTWNQACGLTIAEVGEIVALDADDDEPAALDGGSGNE